MKTTKISDISKYKKNSAFFNFSGGMSNHDTANCTVHSTIKSPVSKFSRVRLIFANKETSAATIDKCVVAVTNSALSGSLRYTPSTGNTVTEDSRTGFVTVTFNGSTSLTIPASIADELPVFFKSDWIDCNSIAAIDGVDDSKPYLCVREFHLNNGHCTSIGTLTASSNVFGRFFNSYQKVGDFIANPSGFTSPSARSFSAFVAVEFETTDNVLNIHSFGDSITEGSTFDTTDSHLGWPHRIQFESVFAGKSISCCNFGWSGKKTSEYLKYFKNIVPLISGISLYSVFSPNDYTTLTETIADDMYNRATTFVNTCRINGVLPIMVFLCPNDNLDLAKDAIRKSLIASIKSMPCEVIDVVSVTGDSESPERFKPAYYADGTHPNMAGIIAMSSQISSDLSSIVSKYMTL